VSSIPDHIRIRVLHAMTVDDDDDLLLWSQCTNFQFTEYITLHCHIKLMWSIRW